MRRLRDMQRGLHWDRLRHGTHLGLPSSVVSPLGVQSRCPAAAVQHLLATGGATFPPVMGLRVCAGAPCADCSHIRPCSVRTAGERPETE